MAYGFSSVAKRRLPMRPRRYATRALARGSYARYRSMAPKRRFTGRFPSKRGRIAGNRTKSYAPRSYHDFPLYLPRNVVVRQEQKYIDAPHVDLYCVTPGLVALPVYPDLGDALYKRLGARILINQLILRGSLSALYKTQASASPVWNVDFFIIYDASPGTTVPDPTAIFTSSSVTTGWGLFQSPDNRDRFQLLYRFRYLLRGNLPKNATGSSAFFSADGDQLTIPIDLTLNINKVTTFQAGAATGDFAGITKGAIYMYASSPMGAASDPTEVPVMHLNSRILFSDL